MTIRDITPSSTNTPIYGPNSATLTEEEVVKLTNGDLFLLPSDYDQDSAIQFVGKSDRENVFDLKSNGGFQDHDRRYESWLLNGVMLMRPYDEATAKRLGREEKKQDRVLEIEGTAEDVYNLLGSKVAYYTKVKVTIIVEPDSLGYGIKETE